MDIITDPAFQTTTVGEIQGKRFWPRAAAYLIDALLLNGISFVVPFASIYILKQFLFLFAPLLQKSYFYIAPLPKVGNYVIGAILMILYFALFEWLYGRSLGKIILGMRVISSDGGPCSWKQALSRSFYRIIDGLVFGVVAAGYMKPPSYQRLGDQKASTLVVSSKDPCIKENPEWWKFFLALFFYLLFNGMIILAWYLLFLRLE